MEVMRKVQIPAFGNWDNYYDYDVPVTQYFDSTIQSDLYKGGYYSSYGHNQEVDLFKAPVNNPLYPYHEHQNLKKERRSREEKQNKTKDDQFMKKQGRVHDLTMQKQMNQARVCKAVDEDLYKIPPELLYKKQKKGRMLKKLWSGCLSLGCIA